MRAYYAMIGAIGFFIIGAYLADISLNASTIDITMKLTALGGAGSFMMGCLFFVLMLQGDWTLRVTKKEDCN